jgi:acyl-CoA thioesterase-1
MTGPRLHTLAVAWLVVALAPMLARGQESQPIILFLGDSLTAGYGLENPAAEAYPALIQQKIHAAGLHFEVVNAGVSGDTSAGGLHRMGWVLRRPPAILVLALGANDGLRGLPPEEMQRNLQGIIDAAKARNPKVRVLVAGMRLPPNFGPDYDARFTAVFPQLVKDNPGVCVLLPFLLEGVGGVERLNQPDHLHPTAEGDRLIADTVWKALEPMCRPAA